MRSRGRGLRAQPLELVLDLNLALSSTMLLRFRCGRATVLGPIIALGDGHAAKGTPAVLAMLRGQRIRQRVLVAVMAGVWPWVLCTAHADTLHFVVVGVFTTRAVG